MQQYSQKIVAILHDFSMMLLYYYSKVFTNQTKFGMTSFASLKFGKYQQISGNENNTLAKVFAVHSVCC